MLKKLLFTTALSGLMLSSALAQYSAPSGSSAAPAASSDAMKSDASKMKSDASKSSTSAATTGASGSATAIAAQKPDQLLASRFKGTDVLGANNEKIGDVSDILFAKDGKIDAYIISVGGFLGVGAKEVALAPSSVQFVQEKEAFKLKVSMTKDQLAQAPNFERHKEQRTTTGAAGSKPNAGGNSMGSGGNPPANRP